MSQTEVGTRCLSGLLARQDADGVSVAIHRMICTVVSGPNAQTVCDVESPRLTIGSAESCDLTLRDDTVSRQHCELSIREDRWVVRDLHSTNGTFLDGVGILEAYIEPGARLQIGESEIIFEGHTRWLPVPPSAQEGFGPLIGRTSAMRAVFGILEKLAPTELNVLLFGETGTGKELAARGVHDTSPRRGGPFVVVDCGALSRNLVESHLFGHERGAFTGADKARLGAFERAKGGTIFLDEIGELPLDLQPKLLRVLERREIEPVGAGEVRSVDVRVLGATHRELEKMVEEGAFREDLYYRLAEIVVELPSLDARREDIPLLALHLLRECETAVQSIAPDALAYLQSRRWDGNVRELRNVIRRAAVLSGGPTLDLNAITSLDRRVAPAGPRAGSSNGNDPLPIGEDLPIRDARDQWLRFMEKHYLQRLNERFDGDIGALAEHMGVHRKSVYRLLRQHGFID